MTRGMGVWEPLLLPDTHISHTYSNLPSSQMPRRNNLRREHVLEHDCDRSAPSSLHLRGRMEVCDALWKSDIVSIVLATRGDKTQRFTKLAHDWQHSRVVSKQWWITIYDGPLPNTHKGSVFAIAKKLFTFGRFRSEYLCTLCECQCDWHYSISVINVL